MEQVTLGEGQVHIGASRRSKFSAWYQAKQDRALGGSGVPTLGVKPGSELNSGKV